MFKKIKDIIKEANLQVDYFCEIHEPEIWFALILITFILAGN